MKTNKKRRSEKELKIRASIAYLSPSPNWEEFFNEYEGIFKEEDLDLNDPITAGILGKL